MEKKRVSVFEPVDVLYICAFFASFLNKILGTIFLLLLFSYWKRGPEGCLKALLLLTTRGIMSSAVAAPLNGNVKWVVLLGTSLWLLLGYRIPDGEEAKTVKIGLSLVGFLIAAAIGALFNSSYPVTALFKMISFSIPFLAVMRGVALTRRYCRWSDYFAALYLILFSINLVLIPFEEYRITNTSFQGVFNHVNMLGMITPVFMAAFLESRLFEDKTALRMLVMGMVVAECYLSASRTGMFSLIAVICIYFLCSHREKKSKYVLAAVLLLSLAVWMLYDGSVQQKLSSFIWKGNRTSLFGSRQDIIASAKARFAQDKVFGTGFMVPYSPGVVSFALSFRLTTEPGNLLWMLLGDTGIAGVIFFGIFVLTVLRSGTWERLYLVVAALLPNMGEVVFFSSNNNSILLYLLLAIYVFEEKGNVRNDGILRMRKRKNGR